MLEHLLCKIIKVCYALPILDLCCCLSFLCTNPRSLAMPFYSTDSFIHFTDRRGRAVCQLHSAVLPKASLLEAECNKALVCTDT